MLEGIRTDSIVWAILYIVKYFMLRIFVQDFSDFHESLTRKIVSKFPFVNVYLAKIFQFADSRNFVHWIFSLKVFPNVTKLSRKCLQFYVKLKTPKNMSRKWDFKNFAFKIKIRNKNVEDLLLFLKEASS